MSKTPASNSINLIFQVIWDYHVIFVYKPDDRCLIFDLDSDLPFPTFFQKYVTETFRTDAILNPGMELLPNYQNQVEIEQQVCFFAEYHRFFRVIPAFEFLSTFASDRRHMKKADGSWMKIPPEYPPISTKESTHNLVGGKNKKYKWKVLASLLTPLKVRLGKSQGHSDLDCGKVGQFKLTNNLPFFHRMNSYPWIPQKALVTFCVWRTLLKSSTKANWLKRKKLTFFGI